MKCILNALFGLLGYSLIFPSANAESINVYAAASMTDALTQIAANYTQSEPNTTITFSFAGTSTLAKQIENGAPADIFISADQDWIDYLFEKRKSAKSPNERAGESRVAVVASNELVLIAPKSRLSQPEIDANANLAAQLDGRLCMGDPEHVPAGKYAKQALQHSGWWDTVQSKIVGTEDVRAALAFVERGECSLGIVYRSDAGLSDRVKIIYTFPAESHLPIRFPALLINQSGKTAEAFWLHLQSAQAREILIRYGFTPPVHH